MVTIRYELDCDFAAREVLLNLAFGRTRKRKTSERLREGRLPSQGLAFSATDEAGRLIGSIRLWDVIAGQAGSALLLGPLAVDGAHRNRGIGATLMKHALTQARELGHGAVLLVGDEPYYGRFGFTRAAAAGLQLPGPVDRERFLGLELVPGALESAVGLVAANGRLAQPRRKAA